MENTNQPTIPEEIIANKIFIIRDQKVMLDADLARLYQVETRVLKQAVKRNLSRFPEDFMFQLSENEWNNLRSQFATSKTGLESDGLRSQFVISKKRGGTRYAPFAFTEQGVAMLSSVLKSETAIKMNIQIMRVFTKFRQLYMDNTILQLEVEKIKKKLESHDKNIELVFTYLDELLENREKPAPRKAIGFKVK